VPALTLDDNLNDFNDAFIQSFIERLNGKSGVILVPEEHVNNYWDTYQPELRAGSIQILPARFTGKTLHLDQELQGKLPGANPTNVLFILQKDMLIDAPKSMAKDITVMMLDVLLKGMVMRAHDLGTIDKIAKILKSQA
jgi:hypothetical protein